MKMNPWTMLGIRWLESQIDKNNLISLNMHARIADRALVATYQAQPKPPSYGGLDFRTPFGSNMRPRGSIQEAILDPNRCQTDANKHEKSRCSAEYGRRARIGKIIRNDPNKIPRTMNNPSKNRS